MIATKNATQITLERTKNSNRDWNEEICTNETHKATRPSPVDEQTYKPRLYGTFLRLYGTLSRDS